MDRGTENYRRFRDTGDENAVAEIIKDYREGLIMYLMNIVSDIHTAEDLAEDTFVLLFTRKPRDKGKGSFKTWLYTIGRNLAIDWLRKQSRHAEVPLEEAAEISTEDDIVCSELIHEERKIMLYHSMAKLPHDYRQVLYLRYFEELENKEIAKIMRKSVRSIESLLLRARKQVKELLLKGGFQYEE